MTAYISHTSVDCRDAYRLSEWWKGVLGYVDVPKDPNEAGDEECMILRPDGGHRLARLRESGATEVADLRGKFGAGTGWVVLADPEGNELCTLRGEAEVAHAQ